MRSPESHVSAFVLPLGYSSFPPHSACIASRSDRMLSNHRFTKLHVSASVGAHIFSAVASFVLDIVLVFRDAALGRDHR